MFCFISIGQQLRPKLLEEECSLFCVSWLLLEEFFLEIAFFTAHFSVKTSVNFVVIRQ